MDPERLQWLLTWQPPMEDYFEKMFGLLKAYKETHDGDCNVPEGYEVEGVNLGNWVTRQRMWHKEGKMDPERERRLGDLGFDWDFDNDWEEMFELLKEYKEVLGHCNVPTRYDEVDDIKLGRWVETQRRRYKEGRMDPEHERRLRELGVSLQPLQQDWEERFHLLVEYKEAQGNCDVPYKYEVKGVNLGYWVDRQRRRCKEGKIEQDKERRLMELGFSLQPQKGRRTPRGQQP